ncbi:MAG: hypothetical protein HY319_06615 [Armatimonadetes bacterium]|nr:hypothetical protein [Armatimonadota bacterium]
MMELIQFRMREIFHITGRGWAVAGEVEAGILRPGDYISVGEERMQIASVEAILKLDDDGRPLPWVGLMLGPCDDAQVRRLRDAAKTGEVLTITAEPPVTP